MEKRTFQRPAFHHQFLSALQNGDLAAFYYFHLSYMTPLTFVILPATGNYHESFQLMMKTFIIAKERIKDYIDDEANCFFMWLFRLLVEYLSKTPGKESLHQYFTDLIAKMDPHY